MALTDDNGSGMVMPVAPMYGGGYGNGNGFGFGGDGWWIILLFIILGGWGGYGNGGFGGNIGGEIYPWMNQANLTSEGFQNQLMNDSITSIRDGVFGISTQLCNGFAGVNATVANGFAQAEIANNARQIADMQQNFALSQQLSQCCCDNKTATQSLAYNIATEACADRNAISSALRDVLEANNASTQRILDKMCDQEIQAKNDRIQELQTQLNMAALAASQNQQTQLLVADNAAQTQYIVNRVAPYPTPAYIVSSPYTPVSV